MAKIAMKGLNEYTKALSKLEAGVRDKVCGAAIYDGADIVADAIRSSVEGLPTDSGYGTPERPLDGPNKAQKEALLDSLGVTPMRDTDGVLDVKIGFDGYNNIRTRRWPRGQPNQLVARSIERGTSFMVAHPVFKKTVAAVRKSVLAAMGKSVDKSIKDIMKK